MFLPSSFLLNDSFSFFGFIGWFGLVWVGYGWFWLPSSAFLCIQAVASLCERGVEDRVKAGEARFFSLLGDWLFGRIFFCFGSFRCLEEHF